MEEIDQILAQFTHSASPTNPALNKVLPEIRFILLKIWVKKCEALAMLESWYFINKLKASLAPGKKLRDLGLNN